MEDRCECGFKSPLATHTVGLRKIQNANKHKTQKRVKTVTIESHCSSREMNKKQIVLEKSARLNLDAGRGDRVDGGDGRSFARGWSLRMIICKSLDPPDDYLQEAGSSGWFSTKGRILRMIICNNKNNYINNNKNKEK